MPELRHLFDIVIIAIQIVTLFVLYERNNRGDDE